MGRGRQKAKQTKVARELKYYSPETDYERLQRELRGDPLVPAPAPVAEVESDEEDEYGSWQSGSSS